MYGLRNLLSILASIAVGGVFRLKNDGSSPPTTLLIVPFSPGRHTNMFHLLFYQSHADEPGIRMRDVVYKDN